jgi:hypothetical protein
MAHRHLNDITTRRQPFDDMAPQKPAAPENGGGMGRGIMGSGVVSGHGKTLYAVCRVKWVGNHR